MVTVTQQISSNYYYYVDAGWSVGNLNLFTTSSQKEKNYIHILMRNNYTEVKMNEIVALIFTTTNSCLQVYGRTYKYKIYYMFIK